MRHFARALALALFVYFCWLGMMGVHELGHVVHAKLSGGVVQRVSFPPLGFSQTILRYNPHPPMVAWGGPLWGSVLPVLLWAIVPTRWSIVRRAMQFFAGFCLIANGAYIGIGWTIGAGDAGDLLHYGTPLWLMCAFGLVEITAGLLLWHLLGRKPPQSPLTSSAGET